MASAKGVMTALVLSTAALGAQRATRQDIRAAMSDTAHGFVRYSSDGSARGDSARRIGGLAGWDLEGGNVGRGQRLLREALERGVADTLFYHDAFAYFNMLPHAALELARVRKAATRQFPSHQWPWSGTKHSMPSARSGRQNSARALLTPVAADEAADVL